MLEALKAWLETLTTDDVFLEFTPDSPDALVVCREYSGQQLVGLEKHDRSVQLTFRATDTQSAHDAAWNVYGELVPVPLVYTATGGGKVIVRPIQSPFFLDRDAKGRTTYAFNAAVYAQPD